MRRSVSLGSSFGGDKSTRSTSASGRHQHGPKHDLDQASGNSKLWQKLPRKLPLLGPHHPFIKSWWYVTVAAAAVIGVVTPLRIAFKMNPSLTPFTGFYSAAELMVDLVFLADILLRLLVFVVALPDGTILEQRKDIVMEYARGMLIPHLIITIPWDQIALAAAGLTHSDSNKALAIALLGLLKLARLGRVWTFFTGLTSSMKISPFLLMLLRNETYLFYLMHWAACTLYYMARVGNFSSDNTWLGRAWYRVDGEPMLVRYIYSFYFAVSTYTGLGDQDFGTSSVVESGFMILFMSFNVVVSAYILGTVSMLMVLSDKRSKLYRDRMGNLKDFVKLNSIPPTLAESMCEHLELHHNNEHAGEERVLSLYPAAIKRRVKRHLYLSTVRQCYLFKGCKAKFVDAVLVQVLSAGDIVNELMVVVDGQMKTTAPSARRIGGIPDDDEDDAIDLMRRPTYGHAAEMALEVSEDLMTRGSGGRDAKVPTKQKYSAGRAAFVRFQQQLPQEDLVRAASVAQLDSPFPRHMLPTLPSPTSSVHRNAVAPAPIPSPSPAAVHRLAASQHFNDSANKSEYPSKSRAAVPVVNVDSPTVGPASPIKAFLGPDDSPVIKTLPLTPIRGIDSQHSEARSISHDGVARGGNSNSNHGRHGSDPGNLRGGKMAGTADAEASRSRLTSMSGPNDSNGFKPVKAGKSGGSHMAGALRRGGLTLGMDSVHGQASYKAAEGLLSVLDAGHCLGELAFFSEEPTTDSMWTSSVTRLLVLDKGAYEQLAAQHPQQTKLLMDNLQRRMEENLHLSYAAGIDAIPEVPVEVIRELAHYVFGDRPIHMMPAALKTRVSRLVSSVDWENIQTEEKHAATARQLALNLSQMRVFNFLEAASKSDVEAIKTMIAHGVSPDSADYDKRTGLMLACHEGSEAVTRLLLESGADPMIKDNFGNTAMWEAVKMGHDGLIDLLLKYKASLGVDGMMVAAQMCTCVFEGDLVMLRRILKSGCDPDSADYDKRCALHIACCEGSVTAVRLLIEEGGATVDFHDRWGATPLSEAERVKAQPVVEYLTPLTELANKGVIRCMEYPRAPTYKDYKEQQDAKKAQDDADARLKQRPSMMSGSSITQSVTRK